MSQEQFPNFQAYIPKLSLIQSDELRSQIVSTYANARGFVMTVNHHNAILSASDEANRRLVADSSSVSIHDARLRDMSLTAYSDALRESYENVEKQASALLAALRGA
jgi:hypothetical protein